MDIELSLYEMDDTVVQVVLVSTKKYRRVLRQPAMHVHGEAKSDAFMVLVLKLPTLVTASFYAWRCATVGGKLRIRCRRTSVRQVTFPSPDL